MGKISKIDLKLLRLLQRDASMAQRELAERVNLSINACWNRVQNLRKNKVILGQRAILNREALGYGLVVFMMVKTRHHSGDWLQAFKDHVLSIPQVIDFYRIGGDYDYLIKVNTADMASFDQIYQQLIAGVELDAVTSYFAMEAIAEQRGLPV